MGKCFGDSKISNIFKMPDIPDSIEKQSTPWGALLCDNNCVYDCGTWF